MSLCIESTFTAVVKLFIYMYIHTHIMVCISMHTGMDIHMYTHALFSAPSYVTVFIFRTLAAPSSFYFTSALSLFQVSTLKASC